MKNKKKSIRADLLLLLGIAAAGGVMGLVLLLTSGAGATVQVRVGGDVQATYSLEEDRTVTIEGKGGTNLLVIENGTASITEADCPDALCVNMGSISKNGQSIVCLPHEVVVEVISETDDSGVDLMAG